MPSFDAERSLTNDVVRGAIIPRSRVGTGGKALVSIWEKSAMPQNMVTHNWTNRFACLVGGIVADALNEDKYQTIAEQLSSEEGVELLKQRLVECEKMDATYWVCAFSVNQHASICGGYGPTPPKNAPEWEAWNKKRYDSVSLQKFSLCYCLEPKILNHSNPACELNKFDDMMRFLHERVAMFGQVLVVDEQFEVLYRAWCVAEVMEANFLDIPTRVKVLSQDAVDCNYDRLSTLDVRDCSASSAGDKDLILQKISDVDAFNLKLQQSPSLTELNWCSL